MVNLVIPKNYPTNFTLWVTTSVVIFEPTYFLIGGCWVELSLFYGFGYFIYLLFNMMKKCSLKGILSNCRAIYLRKGLVPLLVLSKFLELNSVRSLLSSDLNKVISFRKDMACELKNNNHINWHAVL